MTIELDRNSIEIMRDAETTSDVKKQKERERGETDRERLFVSIRRVWPISKKREKEGEEEEELLVYSIIRMNERMNK